MRKHVTAVFAILTAAVLTVACAQTDAGVTTKVKSKLAADDTVKAYQIDVDTRDHVVTLSGTVDTEAAKERAVALARESDGVMDVIVNIQVGDGNAALPGEHNATPTTGVGDTMRDGADKMDDAAREGANKVGDVAREGANKVGDVAREGANKVGDAAREGANKMGDAASKMGDVGSDAGITAAVKAKMLADAAVSGLRIDVDTDNGVVTLTGDVKNAAEKAAAVRIARGTDGVKSVKDNLKLGR